MIFFFEKDYSIEQQNDRGEIPVIKWINNNQYVLNVRDDK